MFLPPVQCWHPRLRACVLVWLWLWLGNLSQIPLGLLATISLMLHWGEGGCGPASCPLRGPHPSYLDIPRSISKFWTKREIKRWWGRWDPNITPMIKVMSPHTDKWEGRACSGKHGQNLEPPEVPQENQVSTPPSLFNFSFVVFNGLLLLFLLF